MDSSISSAASLQDSPPTHRFTWEPSPSHHANGHASSSQSSTQPPTPDPEKALFAISLRAFILGFGFGVSLLSALILIIQQNSPLWRAPFFLTVLSLFHFLEYYTTARYNPPAASISAFLLSQNGSAYNIAHTLALLECLLRHYCALQYPQWKYLQPMNTYLWPELQMAWLTLGFVLLVVGQASRTMAMVQAGTNFSHVVQSRKKEGHVLVTDGIYHWLRHPSYFGFFWWGIGTQVVMGNLLCLVGYNVVLWRFFRHRIDSKWVLRLFLDIS